MHDELTILCNFILHIILYALLIKLTIVRKQLFSMKFCNRYNTFVHHSLIKGIENSIFYEVLNRTFSKFENV